MHLIGGHNRIVVRTTLLRKAKCEGKGKEGGCSVANALRDMLSHKE